MKFALIDFDNTLSKGDSMIEILKLMENKGKISKGYAKQADDIAKRFIAKECDYNQCVDENWNLIGQYLNNMKTLDFIKFVRDIYHLENYYEPWAIELITKLQERGYLVSILSGALDIVLELAQEEMNYDAFFGSKLALQRSKFTNIVEIVMNDLVKANLAKKIIKDSEFTIALGDSTGDKEMLKLANKAFLYIPDRNLDLAGDRSGYEVVNPQDVLENVLNNIE